MNLLGTEKYRNVLSENLTNAEHNVTILSAYATLQGIRWIFEKTRGNIVGRIVVRWHLDDLLNGSSNLEIYEPITEKGWELYIYKDLHAKTILIDDKVLMVGSANITGYGLSIVPGANRELGVVLEATDRDRALLKSIVHESTHVTPELYEEIKKVVEECKSETKPIKKREWPCELSTLFEKAPERLWVTELLWSSPSNIINASITSCSESAVKHDLDVLGLTYEMLSDQENIRNAFLRCRFWLWLKNILEKSENKEAYFGFVTAKLHESLLDDPSPYRREVKEYVQNIFEWVISLSDESIKVDVPGQKSQRIRLCSASSEGCG